jgi:hypothetical protein
MQKLDEIAAKFSPETNVSTGRWFGRPCLKVGRKIGAALWAGEPHPETEPAEDDPRRHITGKRSDRI